MVDALDITSTQKTTAKAPASLRYSAKITAGRVIIEGALEGDASFLATILHAREILVGRRYFVGTVGRHIRDDGWILEKGGEKLERYLPHYRTLLSHHVIGTRWEISSVKETEARTFAHSNLKKIIMTMMKIFLPRHFEIIANNIHLNTVVFKILYAAYAIIHP